MKRVLKTMPIALFTVLFVLTLAFAVLTGTTVLSTATDGVAEAAFQPLAGITFSDFLNAQYGSGGNSGSANITKGGITFQVGTIKDKGTDYLLINSMESLAISFSLPQDINNVAITIYAKFELPAGGYIGNGNIRVNENLSNDLATPTAENNWEIANTYRLNPGLFTNDNNTIRIWFNTCEKDYKLIDLQFSAKNTTNPADPTTHTVLFDKNGGSGGADSVEVTNGSAMPTITFLPTRSGYSFKGYYSATSGGTQYYTSAGASAKNWDKDYGATLYAQWIQSSTVTLNKNNGTGGTNSVVAEPGKAMPSATMPSRTGYTFQGYYDTSATTGGTQYYTSAGASAKNWDKTGDQTLWARWTAINYTITYKDGGNKTFSGTHASGYPTQHTYGTATTLKSATKTGYTFGGWFTNSDCTGTAVTSLGATDYTAAITLYAKWTANQYTVTLDDNGGSGGLGSVGVYFDSNFAPIASAQRPTKAGYTFAGYYDEQNAAGAAFPSGTLYILGTGVPYKAWNKPNDATLYAYYTKNMTVSSSGYEADYDGNSYTITVNVTDPASDPFILYHDPETSSNTEVNPAKTNVGSYTIDFYVSKNGYTQYQGSATIVIKEVDKTALSALIDEVSNYYDGINGDYPAIASTLEGHKQQIINDYITDKNVTAAEVAGAIDELAGYLSTAKVDVTKAKIDAIGSGEYTVEAPKIQDARDYYDNELSAEEKAQVSNYADLQAAETFYGPVGDVVDEIGALSVITDPQEFKSAVETARDHYDALSDDQKDVFPADTLKILTDSEAVVDVMDTINAIGASEDTQSFRDKVSSARADYTALSDDQKGIFPGSVLKVLTDDEAAIDVMDKINLIGTVAYTAESKGKIDTANTAYDALDATQKALVANYATLEQANTDYDKVDEAHGLIALLDPFEYSEDYADALEDAREAYDALTPFQKSIVPADDLKELVDDEKAFDAIAKIEAIGKPVANDDATREKADVARAAVDALTSDQLTLVGTDFIEDLENAEAVIDFMDKVNAIGASEDTQSFRDKVADAANTCDNVLTPNQLALVPESVIKTLTDDEAAIDVMDKINLIGTVAYTAESKGKIDTANTAYDALDATQKALIANYATLEQANTDYDKVDEAHGLIALLDPFEYSEDYADALEDAREAYDALTPFQKSIVPADDLKELVDDEKAFDAVVKIKDIGTPVANDDATREKADVARDAVDALTADQLDLVDPFIEDLEDSEAVIDFMDKVNAIGTPEDTQSFRDKVADAANVFDNKLTPNQVALVPEDVIKALTDDEALVPVMDAIDALGTPANTDAFRTAVEGARTDYTALSDDQKALFPADVLKTLEDDEAIIDALDEIDAIGDVEYTPESKALIDAAREEYDALSADQKAKFPSSDLQTLVDAEKAYEAMDEIENIGTIENTPECKQSIVDARNFYNALTPEQKELVSEDFVKALEDAEAVYDAIEQINAIGEIGYDSESEEAIRAAREAYDGLSEDQKALMPQSAINDLEADEQTFATKSDNAKKLYIALLVILAIALCVSICFLIFLLYKRKNDKDKKQEKVMSSVLVVPVILAASYYASAPFIAIYILAGLLVASIVANIAIAANKKKKEAKNNAQKAEQKAKKQADEPHDDAKNYVCIADDSEPTYDLRHDVVEEPEQPAEEPAQEPEQPAEEPVQEEPADEPAEEPVEEAEEPEEEVAADSADEDEKAAEEELEQEEEPTEELETVEDVKVEEPVTLKQSMSVARHNVGHKSQIGKEFCASYLEEKYEDAAETNRRDNYTSTGLPLADTHYALGDKTRKCFVYVYDLEETSMLLINSDEELASELNKRHGNVHKSAFPKSKDQWYSVALDDTYTEDEVKDILDRCFKHAGGKYEEELSLKESLAIAKNVKTEKSTHTTTKKSICEYLAGKYGDEVEINTRDNYTSTGLPLADTHYVKGEDGKSRCFVYVYETQGSMMLLIKANHEFAKKLSKEHANVHRSAFPKSKEPWNSVVLDDSFSDEEVHKLLDDIIALNK